MCIYIYIVLSLTLSLCIGVGAEFKTSRCYAVTIENSRDGVTPPPTPSG